MLIGSSVAPSGRQGGDGEFTRGCRDPEVGTPGSDRGGVHVKEGVPNLGVTPGTYRVIVRAKARSSPYLCMQREKEFMCKMKIIVILDYMDMREALFFFIHLFMTDIL